MKIHKKFFISDIVAFELLACDSPSYGENTCDWKTIF